MFPATHIPQFTAFRKALRGAYHLLAVACWLLAGSYCANAQVVSGVVENSTRTPLPSAQVVLYLGEEMSEYALTDATGKFSLEAASTAPDSARVEIRYFGYATARYPLAEARRTERFILKAEGVALQEVVVAESALPIVRRSDTLIYDTEAYSDGSERKVEDLLRNLPGVEVSEEGDVKVGGREIDRILVEGQDAFGKNYKMASQNINAGFIDQVEVIENYTDDPLTGDLSGQEELVLNLGFTQEGQNVLFGELKAAAGNRGASETDGNAFALGTRRTLALFGQTNTLGKKPSSSGDLRAKTGEDLSSAGIQPPANLLHPVSGNNVRALRTEDYLNNSALSTAGSLLLQPSKKVRSRTIFAADRQRSNLEQFQQSIRVTGNGLLTIDQFDDFTNQNRDLWIETDNRFAWNPSSRLDIRLTGASVNTTDEATLSSTFDDTTDDVLSTDLTGSRRELTAEIRQIFRTGDKGAFRLGLTGQRHRLDQQAVYTSDRYLALPQVQGQVVEQSVERSENRGDAYAEFLTGGSGINLTFRTGFRESSGRLSGNLTGQESLLRYQLREIYLAATARRDVGKLRTEITAEGVRPKLTYGTGSGVQPTGQPLMARINGSIVYRISTRGRFSFGVGTDRRLPRPTELLPGPYLSDFQTFTQGLSEPYLQRIHSVFARYNHQNIFHQFSYQLSFNQGWTPNGLGSTVTADGPLLLRTLQPGLPSGTRRLAARVEKYVNPLNANVRLSADRTEIRSQLDLGVANGVNVYRVTRFKASYQAQLLPTVKASAGYEYRILTNSLAVATAGEPNATLRTERLEALLSWKPSKKIHLQTALRRYGWRQPTGLRPTTLLSATASYVFNDRWALSLRAFNLLGQAEVSWAQANSFLSTRRTLPLRDRTFLLEATYGF